MPRASRYEREFISFLSHFGLVARLAASGTLNTIVGDLILIPSKEYRDLFPRPAIVEVKATHYPVYYPSKHFKQLDLLVRLSKHFDYDPYLAVKFIGRGWVFLPLFEIPEKVVPENLITMPADRKTIEAWLSEIAKKGREHI